MWEPAERQSQGTKAALYIPDKECYNCGATEGLLRCSRCKHAWFCSPKCQKAYWPMHKSECRVNEFAAAIESTEPSFAEWMRRHGKQAVLKDAEVERLERASRAVCSLPSRQETLESMYGRANLAPLAPAYSPEEWLAMEQRQQQEQQKALWLLSATPQQKTWQALPPIPDGMGLVCAKYRWAQNLSHVDVHMLLPGHMHPRQVQVVITSSRLEVAFDRQPVLSGPLYKQVDAEGCTWYIGTGVLHIQLLKHCRKGRYLKQVPNSYLTASSTADSCLANENTTGCEAIKEEEGGNTGRSESSSATKALSEKVVPGTSADTFWQALLQGASAAEQLQSSIPPTAYFFSEYDAQECFGPSTPARSA